MELDDLLTAAHEQARRVLLHKADEQLVPMWLLVNNLDEKMIIATPFNEHTNRDLVAINMQRIMKENQTIAYSFLTEAWAVMRPKDTNLDNAPRPSQSPDRQEIVLAIACNPTTTKSRSWSIKRDRRNRITALIEQESHSSATAFGRFANLLQPMHS